MSCEQTAWGAAAAAYNADMAALEQACLAEEQAAQGVADAEAALADANAALVAAAEAHESAKQKAAISQLATVAEADKLGVACACPETGPTPLGTRR